MSLPLILSMGGVLFAAMLTTGWLMLRDIQQRNRLHARVLTIHGKPPAQSIVTQSAAFRAALMRAIAAIGQATLRSGLISARTLDDVQKTLSGSGLRGPQALALFVGGKILLACALPVAAWVALGHVALPGMLHTLLPGAAGVVGLIAPDYLIGKKRKRYLAQLDRGLPDALDLMVICTQAGLALGPTIIRVAIELQHSYPEIASEFELTANELQVLSEARTALNNLGTRTGLEGYRRLATTLNQTIQYGTPIAEALRILSTEMRQEMLTKFEERAARLPVLLTMPMIGFILPCIFLIVGGPAMIQVMKAFYH